MATATRREKFLESVTFNDGPTLTDITFDPGLRAPYATINSLSFVKSRTMNALMRDYYSPTMKSVAPSWNLK